MQTKISTRKTAVVWFVSIAILFFMFMLLPIFFGLSKASASPLDSYYNEFSPLQKLELEGLPITPAIYTSTSAKNTYNSLISTKLPKLSGPESNPDELPFTLRDQLLIYLIGSEQLPNTIIWFTSSSNPYKPSAGSREYRALEMVEEMARVVINFLEEREVEIATKVVLQFSLLDTTDTLYKNSVPTGLNGLRFFLQQKKDFEKDFANNSTAMTFITNSIDNISVLKLKPVAVGYIFETPITTNVENRTIKWIFDEIQARLKQNIDKLSLWVGIDDALADEFGIEKQLDFVTTLEAFETQLGLEPPIEETDPADKNRLTAFRAQVQALKTLVTSTSGHLAMLITQDDFIDTFFADILSEETLKEENQGKTNAQIKEIAGARYLAQITNRINTVEQNLSERIKRISNSNPLGIPGWAIFLALLFIVLVIGFAYMVHLGVLNYGRSKKQTAEARERKGLWPFNKGNKK